MDFMNRESFKIEVEVGFKTYREGTGENAVKLAKICEELASNYGVNLVITVQVVDIYRIATRVKLPILAQHVDPIPYGRYNGWILPEAVKEAGAVGSLLNHCERPLTLNVIEKTIRRLKELDMISVVCARSIRMAKKIAKFDPDFIMIELPELIGTKSSISQVSPRFIINAIRSVKEINPKVKILCGGGISTKEDVVKAFMLGAEGVGITSAVVCANDPKKALTEILQGVVLARNQ